jgi:hypothetical protein
MESSNTPADSSIESAQSGRETHLDGSVQMPRIFMVKIADLVLPPFQPRKTIEPGPLADLVAHIQTGAAIPRILVWRASGQRSQTEGQFLNVPISEPEIGKKVADPWMILSGQMRTEAYKVLGRTEIEAEEFIGTRAQAAQRSQTENQRSDPYWLEKYEGWEETKKEYPNAGIVEFADIVGVTPTVMSRAMDLMLVLTPQSRELIRQHWKKLIEVDDLTSNFVARGKKVKSATKKRTRKLPKDVFTSKSARPLIGLLADRKPEEAQILADQAVPLILELKMNEAKVKELVQALKAGKTVEEFKASKGHKPAPTGPRKEQTNPPTELGADPSTGSGSTGPTTSSTVPTGADSSTESAQPKIKPRIESSASVQTPEVSGQTPVNKPNFIDEVLAGVSVIQPIRAKVKAGEAVSKRERLFLLACFVWGFLKWAWKASRPIRHGILKGIKALHQIGKKPAKFFYPLHHSKSSGSGNLNQGIDRLIELLSHGAVYVFCQIAFLEAVIGLISIPFPGLKPWLEWLPRLAVHEGLVVFPAWAWAYGKANLIPGVIFLFLGIFLLAYAAAKNPLPIILLVCLLGLAGYYGRNWGEIPAPWLSKSNPSQETVKAPVSPLPVAAPPPVKVVSSHAKTMDRVKPIQSKPDANSDSELAQPKLAASPEDSQQVDIPLLQEEIAAVPPNCIIKPFPVEPDGSIGQLMAVNRLGDLEVESEYSLRVGQGGQKITSITPSATGVVIVTEGGLPLGSFLGGGSNIEFYWEDVLTIYCNELDVKENGKTKVIYQCSLTATNLNQPLVVQCYTVNNLKHLVSALEYFIKASQGKYVTVTGMPYLNQGMVLGDEGKITAIWAGSPADNGELQLGDHLWSVNGEAHKSPSDLKAELQALPSGKQTIEVVTPKDWDTEKEKESRLKSKNFHPNLLEFELAVR